MKVLFLLQSLPYPPAGGMGWKAYTLIRYLASIGWACDIICFGGKASRSRVPEFEKNIPGVRVLAVIPALSGWRRAVRKIRCLLKGLPPSLGEFDSADFRAALSKITSKARYEVVHYDVINMAQYLPWGPKAPSVLSSNDAISLSYESMIRENRGILRKAYLALAARLIRRFERDVYSKFDRVHVVSEEDAVHLRGISPEMPLEIIPIAVDSSFLDYKPSGPGDGRAACRVVFTGNLDIPGIANGLFDFLDKAYRDVLAASPFEFYVSGPGASEQDEKRLSAFPGLKYYRWVEDYKAFLASADIVLILDRSGTGIKTRVLEAMALSKPVIGTSIAFGGIKAEDGKHCLISNSTQEAAAALKRLLIDPSLRKNIGEAARDLVLAEYTMGFVGPKWERLYGNAIAAAGSSRFYGDNAR